MDPNDAIMTWLYHEFSNSNLEFSNRIILSVRYSTNYKALFIYYFTWSPQHPSKRRQEL